jgi:hypothetical protein
VASSTRRQSRWPKKAEKVAAVLTPVSEITSLKPRVEVRPGVSQTAMFGTDTKIMGRQVIVNVVENGAARSPQNLTRWLVLDLVLIGLPVNKAMIGDNGNG